MKKEGEFLENGIESRICIENKNIYDDYKNFIVIKIEILI